MIQLRASRTTMLAVALFFASPHCAWADDAEEKPGERPLIEVSLISAPKRAGDFVLEQSSYDPQTKHAGAGFRYVHPDHKAVRLDVFVYPAGEMPEKKALERGMADFMRSFDAGVQMKYYHDLTVVGREPFVIAPQPSAHSDGDKDASPELLAALAGKAIEGERVDLRYRIHMEDTGENVMMRSRGYLFYKQLYYFKGRISAAESLVDQTTYNALTDQAMRELVQAIDVRNVGGCARSQITLDSSLLDRKDDGKSISVALAQSLVENASRNCFDTLSDAKREGARKAETITIEYDADDWKSQ